MRKTLRTAVPLEGIGLHGGKAVTAVFRPAPAGTGIVFRRSDLPADVRTVPARYDLVTDTRLCTKLTNAAGASVGTVEHAMAALAGLGLTDVVVDVSGPEMPIMDGSSEEIVACLAEAGSVTLAAPLRAIRIRREVAVEDDGRLARLMPAPRFCMAFAVAFEEAAIGEQALSLTLTGDAFLRELADCRTFGRLAEVEGLRAHGLGLGGSLDNAIVVDRGRVLNPGGLRRPDEFVRHKMLDAVGDLALAGAPIVGRYEGVKSGHEMTNRLLRALFADPTAWEWTTPQPGQLLGAEARQPAPLPAETRIAV